jgi:sugar phosphate isomerase/epimerase
MKLGVFTVLFNERPLEDVLQYVASLGYEAVELAAWKASNHFDIDEALANSDYRSKLNQLMEAHALTVSAVSNHLEGRLILGPLDATTDAWAPSSDHDEKVAYGIERMKNTARAAAAIGVQTVVGFTGSNVWDKWYSFPPDNESAYERAWELFADRWKPILDVFEQEGVRFALEVHPGEIAYNIETTARLLEVLDRRPSFGLNFDPSHFVWQLIDPVLFLHEFADRVYHAHAKDAELPRHALARSGVIPNGAWTRTDRGFRFRVPGWGAVEWRRVLTALIEAGYNDVLSFEHEDSVMSREDGCKQAIQFLRPLMIDEPQTQWGVWWEHEDADASRAESRQ